MKTPITRTLVAQLLAGGSDPEFGWPFIAQLFAQIPLVNALSVWMQIPDAPLLIADVNGHQSLILSKCAYAAMVRFTNSPSSVSSTTICPK